MKRQIFLILLTLVSASFPNWTSNAQTTPNYKLSWTTFDAGGSSSTGGVYAGSSSIGQPNSGALSAGPYTMTAGFFSGTDVDNPNDPCSRLQITGQPRSITNHCSSDCATFGVGVIGSSPIAAQWYFNGSPIPGANGLSYTVCPVTAANVGLYSVSLSNACSHADSERAFLVIVADTNAPVITCPLNIVVWTCNPNGVAVNYPMPGATDDYDPTPAVFCTPPSGSVFPPGTTTVICEAFDDCRNRNRCAFDVTVLRDTTPPRITCPSNMIVCATSEKGAIVSFAPVATDDYTQMVTIKCTPESGSLFPFGTTAVICEATDDCGNAIRCEFTVEVVQPTLAITKTPHGIVITWDCGKLEEADAVTGPWSSLANATSPYAVSADARRKFYRLRSQ